MATLSFATTRLIDTTGPWGSGSHDALGPNDWQGLRLREALGEDHPAVWSGERLRHPIQRLTAAADMLACGEGCVAVPVEGAIELSGLARAFNRMAARVREREDRLQAALQRERAIADTLQTAFLPQRLPDCPGYTFAASYHPALQEAEVGGDFYDVFRLPGGGIGLLLGDVSGKGLAAASHAMMARHTVRAYALQTDSPREVLGRANEALCASMDDPERFVTAFYAVLHPETGALRYANAGHWPALLAREPAVEVVGGRSLALGICSGTEYEEEQLQLGPGDRFLIYTDGLVEIGADDPMVHLEAVRTALRRGRGEPLPSLLERLYRDALRRGSGSLRDDVALLALQCEAQP